MPFFSGGKPGTLIRIKADYRQQPDGTLKGYAQSTKMVFEYTLLGGDEVFEPFWYLGFRYLEVEAVTGPEAGQPAFDDCTIRMVVRHNKVDPERSSFECSDQMLSAVWELVKRSAMFGSQEHFVDTPTREQGQFVHDAYQTSLAAMKCFGERDLTQQGLREIAHSQDKWHTDTGKVNALYPIGESAKNPYLGKRDIPDWTQGWVFWAYEYYQETGDRELINDIFDNLVRTGLYNKNSENKTTGLIDWGNDPGYSSGIVDWPDRYGYDRTTTQRTVLSCFAYLDYLYIARLAAALGREAEARQFAGYATAIRAAVQRHLWNDQKAAYVDGLYADGSQSPSTSQQANMVPLVLGFADAKQAPGAMAAVKKAGYATSPMLVRFLIQAYGEYDQDEALLKFLTDPTGLNWAYIIADGGSFTYENWRGRLRKISEDSESHPVGAYGGVIAVQNYILGVQPLAPQYARLQIRPHPAQLEYAKGTIPTQRGPIYVSWKNDPPDAGFSLTTCLPCNVRANVYLPRGRADGTSITVNGKRRKAVANGDYLLIKDVGSGEHVFVRQSAATWPRGFSTGRPR